MKTRRLRHAPHPVHFRHDVPENARIGHQFQTTARSAARENFV